MAKENCWLCGLPILAHGPDLLKTSRDHVVPKSARGYLRYLLVKEHKRAGAKSNLRPAHRWCNSRRGDREVTEELRSDIRELVMSKFPDYWNQYRKAQPPPKGRTEPAH